MSDASRIMSIFEGHADLYGTHGRGVANANKGGKLEIRTTARTIREPVTESLWVDHLSGKMPLGIVTLRADFTVKWGCVDVDDYTVNHADLVLRLKREALPMLVCRTKSGGAHVYIFFSEYLPAELVMSKLRQISAVLGYGTSEVFPKQSKANFEAGDSASWLNMPYLGGDKTERYCVNEKGNGLTLRQFLSAAEKASITRAQFEALAVTPAAKAETTNGRNSQDPGIDGAPPCLQTLFEAKLGEGQRNEGLLAVCVFAKKKWPETWQVKVRELNLSYFNPPLPDEEVTQTINNCTKKAYNYRCKQNPIVQVCNAPLCKTRRYGVGGGASGGGGGMPRLGNLAVLNTDEPVWFLDVEDQRVQFSTMEMMNYGGFQTKCLAVVHIAPPMLKRDNWIAVLQGLLADVVVIDAPDDAGISGQFYEILEGHLTDRQTALTKEEMLLGKPFWDDDTKRVYFRLRDLQEACERVRFRSMSRTVMIAKLKEIGGTHDFVKLRGKGINVWSIPGDSLERQTSPHATPSIEEAVV